MEPQAPQSTEKIKPIPSHKPYNRTYDRKKVKALAIQGVNASDIAKALDVVPSTITRYLKTIKDEIQQVEQYKGGRADALAFTQLKASAIQDMVFNKWIKNPNTLLSQDDRLLKEVVVACAGVKTYDFNSERLERELSTSNTAVVHSDIKALGELQRQRRGGTGQK